MAHSQLECLEKLRVIEKGHATGINSVITFLDEKHEESICFIQDYSKRPKSDNVH